MTLPTRNATLISGTATENAPWEHASMRSTLREVGEGANGGVARDHWRVQLA